MLSIKGNDQEMAPVAEKDLIEVDSARAVAQIQGAMAIAKRFPRDENQSLNRITQAAKRRKVAEQAEYEYNKGGSSVSGASIRAAETIAQAWGNMISGVTEVVRDGDKRESLMLAYAADLETNNWKFLEWRVPHSQDTRSGPKQLNSGRDIYERTMNDGSRRLRNCLLAVIPGDVTDYFLEKCNETLSNTDIPLVQRLNEMHKVMTDIGVTQPMIENKMGCSFGALTERQLSQLRRIYQAIKDGFGKTSDYFKEAENKTKTEDFKKLLETEVKPAPTFEHKEQSAFDNFKEPFVSKQQKQEDVKEVSQSDLVMQVVEVASLVGLDLEKLIKRCKKDFKKSPREMIVPELKQLLESLKKEVK